MTLTPLQIHALKLSRIDEKCKTLVNEPIETNKVVRVSNPNPYQRFSNRPACSYRVCERENGELFVEYVVSNETGTRYFRITPDDVPEDFYLKPVEPLEKLLSWIANRQGEGEDHSKYPQIVVYHPVCIKTKQTNVELRFSREGVDAGTAYRIRYFVTGAEQYDGGFSLNWDVIPNELMSMILWLPPVQFFRCNHLPTGADWFMLKQIKR